MTSEAARGARWPARELVLLDRIAFSDEPAGDPIVETNVRPRAALRSVF